jgi:hypothetical protein
MTVDLRGYMAIEDRADQQEDRRFHLGVRGGACSPFGPGEALLTLVRPSDLCRFCPHALNKAAPAMGQTTWSSAPSRFGERSMYVGKPHYFIVAIAVARKFAAVVR